MDAIILPRNFNIDNITFGNIKALDNGGKTIYIGYNGKPLIIQTPEMSAPFGSSKWSPNPGSDIGKDKYTLEMSFKGMETNLNLQNFHRLVDTLDEKIVEAGLESSANWFKKKYNSKDVVAALYTPMLKRSKNKETGEPDDKYPPTFRINLPYKNDRIDCEIYNKEREIVTMAQVDKGSKVTAILQCLGLWVAGGKFGCSWKVIQLKVTNPEAIRGFAFQEVEPDVPVTTNNPLFNDADAQSSTSGDDRMETQSKPRPSVQNIDEKECAPSTEMVESSDDEDDMLETTGNKIGESKRKPPLKKK